MCSHVMVIVQDSDDDADVVVMVDFPFWPSFKIKLYLFIYQF